MMIINKFKTNARQALATFRKDNKGVAAIEFAMIAPAMIFLYLGLAEVSLLVMKNRDVSHATSVTADLITQVDDIDEDEMENILDATLAVLELNFAKAGKVSIDVTSLSEDGGGIRSVIGYAKMGSGLNTAFDKDSVSGTLLNSTSGVVVVRMTYEYTSPTKQFVGTQLLTETFMLKPRKSATIPFSGDLTCIPNDTQPRVTSSCTTS